MLYTLKLNEFTAIADSFGGELISYKDGEDLEYLWGGDEKYWIGRSPHLFPIIGTLKNNVTKIYGKDYTMNKHGFARNTDFTVAHKGSNFIEFLLKSNDETGRVYPYDFELYIKHELVEGGFKTSYCVKNIDYKPIHFCIGGHVGFRVPLKKNESFEEYSIFFDREISNSAFISSTDEALNEDLTIPYLEKTNVLNLNYENFDKGAIILDKIQSHSICLKHNNKNQGIRFSFDNFPVLALWTFPKKKAPYICLEPWHGLPAMDTDGEGFEEKHYMITLNKGEKFDISYSVNILY